MRVGLFGGSFNPPHQGHIYISKLAIKKLKLHQVWWIPTKQNPLKERSIYESYNERVGKCYLALKHHRKINVKKFDHIYTEKLVSEIKNRYKTVRFFWIMGADNIQNLHRWKNFKKLIRKVPLMIFSREKILLKSRKAKSWKFISNSKSRVFYNKPLNISSSQIRNLNE